MPTCDNSNPKKPAIHPLRGSLGAVNAPQIVIPKIASHANSQEPNIKAIRPKRGAIVKIDKTPIKEPIAEAVVAVLRAVAPCPDLARGYPSRVVAAFAGVPGILIRIAERDPPYIAPTYIQISITIAMSDGKPKVSPVRRAIPIVAVSPGRAPMIIPRRVDHKALNNIVGVVKYLNNASKRYTKPIIKIPS
jgi:hypothetical protein